MATKSTKNTVKVTLTVERNKSVVKELKPSDLDVKYMGSEPLFVIQPDENRRQAALMIAFNWYSRFYGAKQAKEILIHYLDYNDRKTESKQLRNLDEKDIMTTYAWLARLSMRGLELTSIENERLEAEIQRLFICLAKPEDITKREEEKPQTNRPNVQEIMRGKAKEAQGELEGVLDEFMSADLKLKTDGRVMKELSERNVLPQHISLLVEVWQKKIREFSEVLDTDDKQLKEAYAHYNKTQIKAIIKFCEAIIADLNGYSSVKKASKAPRARKAVPVEKIVKNLKYLKAFEDATHKLKLESVSPTKLHGCSECWVYNTSNRKLTHYIADSYAKTLSVKGNSILGFDKVKSETKTLRKPAMLTEFVKAGKPAKRSVFKDLTTTPTEPNGRFNENIIILQAF